MVQLFVKAVYHYPESQSGPDKNAAGEKHVNLTEIYSDSADFNGGDATDHLLLNPSGGACSILLLLGYIQDVNILYSTSDDNKAGITEVSNYEYKSGYRTNIRSLYQVNCSDGPMRLKIQVYRPRMRADYSLYPKGLRLTEYGVNKLLIQVLMKEVLNEHSVTMANLLRMVQQHTKTETEVMIRGFEMYINDHLSFMETAPLEVLDELFDEYTPILETCCTTADTMRLINEVQKAERNMPYDKKIVWEEHYSFLNTSIRKRIERLKQTNETSYGNPINDR